METKHCTKCKQELSIAEFSKDAAIKSGLRSRCRKCSAKGSKNWRRENPVGHRRNNLRRLYGITLEDYTKLLRQQKGVCAICGEPETRIVHNKLSALSVDHCHKTGLVRGLLCSSCNLVIGNANDSLDILQRAIIYLKQRSK